MLLFDVRRFDKSSKVSARDGHGYDRDVLAAARELDRRGASSIVVGGEAASAAGAVLAAPKIEGLAGLVLLSPMQGVPGSKGDGVAAMGSVTVPAFVASTTNPGSGDGPAFADLAERFAEASTVPGTELQLVSGPSEGVALVKAGGPLRDQLLAFIGRVSPEQHFFERWWPQIVGGVVLLGVLAVVFVWRRRLSATRRGVVDTV